MGSLVPRITTDSQTRPGPSRAAGAPSPFRPGLRVWLIAVLFLLAGVAVLPLDMPTAGWCALQTARQPPFVREMLDNCAPFGHGVGVLVAAGLVFCLDGLRRRACAWVLVSGFGAGLLAAGVKLLTRRVRPRGFDFATDQVSATFQGWWLPAWSEHVGSLPSAHTATAVALAVVLAVLYPRGRVLFGMLALLAAAQRVYAGAHFPSDVLFGAALGWVIGLRCAWRATCCIGGAAADRRAAVEATAGGSGRAAA
jgi:PAP2 superfamily